MDDIWKTLLTIACSGGFLAFLQFLIARFDTKHDKFKALEKKIDEGLNARDESSKARYDELRLTHQQDFQELQKAISQLVENDAKFTESIKKIAETQDYIAQANVGMIHSTIIQFTDKIVERDSVTYEELSTLDSLYVPYSKLGGNGECKRRYEDVNKLAKVSKEEAVKRDREIETEKYEEIQKAIRTG